MTSLLDALIGEGLAAEPSDASSCKVCRTSAPLFDVVDFARSCGADPYRDGLSGVPIYWHRCPDCGLLFTTAFDRMSSRGWQSFVYNDHYYQALDTDYLRIRPTLNAEVVHQVCLARRGEVRGLDYGGGNGALAALLRQSGQAFMTHDPYGASDDVEPLAGRFNVLSTFEVLEHTVDPHATFADMLRFAAPEFVMVASTQTADGLVDPSRRLAWDYAAPRNGHVTIYERRTLTRLAQAHGLDHLPVSRGLHLFGRGVALEPLKWAAGWVKLKQRVRARLGR